MTELELFELNKKFVELNEKISATNASVLMLTEKVKIIIYWLGILTLGLGGVKGIDIFLKLFGNG